MPHHLWSLRLLQENFNLGLGFPQKGFVFFRILFKESFSYLYDRILDEASVSTAGQISADEFLNAFVFENASGDDILEVREVDHIYHLFYGISTSALRTYLYMPSQTARRAPDVETIVARAKWGYIDGFESGFNEPSPRTEVFIPEGENLIAFAIWNPLTVPITDPLVWFTGAKYKVMVIRDVPTVIRLIRGEAPARFATIGGAKEEFPYDPRSRWDVDFVRPGMTETEIRAALTPRRSA